MDIKSFWPELGPSLEEASVYLNKYKNKKIVLKYGGQVMSDQSLSKAFAQDAAILRKLDIDVTVIHGGGPQIKTKLDAQNLESKFISGLRVTDKNVIKVVEDVLLNEINPDLRDAINHYGGKAESVTVRKNNIIHIDRAIDEQLGFVGEPKKIDIKILNNLLKEKIIPVIAPMGMDAKGQVYNINADTAAGTIANQIKAERLLLMTDVPGVNDKQGNLISQLSTQQALDLINDGTITGGMIPKIKTCISAIEVGRKWCCYY